MVKLLKESALWVSAVNKNRNLSREPEANQCLHVSTNLLAVQFLRSLFIRFYFEKGR
jgi:hypothetical protein